jgi:hypothetical protein
VKADGEGELPASQQHRVETIHCTSFQGLGKFRTSRGAITVRCNTITVAHVFVTVVLCCFPVERGD